ncbi:MAG: alkaline shock response membrane anchor protein AmaP [Chlamydiae bacterium]|nr:alkaline shock response membrane anchor protein AmaP [Chlamydiota bacterium]MBI3277714.1 alkaline shock response membrane anchor protein AmaP [Chlamydiota bacterium]
MASLFLFIMSLFHLSLALGLVIVLCQLSYTSQPIIWLISHYRFCLKFSWPEHYFAQTAAILFLLEVEYLAIKIRKGKKERYLTFRHPEGRVFLSIRAIETFIEKISQGFHEIKSIQPKVTRYRKAIKIILNVSLWSGSNLATVSEELQKHIKSQVQNILGIEKVIQLEVSVIEISEKKADLLEGKGFQGVVTP